MIMNTLRVGGTKSNLVFLYFPKQVILSEESIVYEFRELISEVGGYIGMLLGISFLDLAQAMSEFLEIKIEQLMMTKVTNLFNK